MKFVLKRHRKNNGTNHGKTDMELITEKIKIEQIMEKMIANSSRKKNEMEQIMEKMIWNSSRKKN